MVTGCLSSINLISLDCKRSFSKEGACLGLTFSDKALLKLDFLLNCSWAICLGVIILGGELEDTEDEDRWFLEDEIRDSY